MTSLILPSPSHLCLDALMLDWELGLNLMGSAGCGDWNAGSNDDFHGLEGGCTHDGVAKSRAQLGLD